MQLFDQLKPLHGLNRKARELIEYAALLHDIGWHISRDRHHKHGMYLIQHGKLKGFAPEEVGIVANIVRYHRKAKPSAKHEYFGCFPVAAGKSCVWGPRCCEYRTAWIGAIARSYHQSPAQFIAEK